MLRDHPFSQRNFKTERALKMGFGGDRKVGVGWGGGVQTKFIKRGGGRVGNIVGVFIKIAHKR